MSEIFLRSKMLLGEKAMETLKNSHVAVFGLGGVGSWCSEALCRAGVGKLTLIDQDVVSVSNINRQICAVHSAIGQPKAEAMARRLLDINPHAEIIPIVKRYDAENCGFFFTEYYDYIADCIDLVACKLDLVEAAMKRGVPIISALGTGNKLDAQSLKIADISETSGCPFARVVRKELRKRGITQLDVVFSTEQATAPEDLEEPPPGRRSVPGSLVWVPATAGFLICSHVVMNLVGKIENG